jgi:hypothetical protein
MRLAAARAGPLHDELYEQPVGVVSRQSNAAQGVWLSRIQGARRGLMLDNCI